MLRRVARIGLPLILAAAVAGPSAAQVSALEGLEPGQRLEERDLKRGQVVAVVFASWSPRCRDIVQRINALERRWGSRARVIAINFQEEPQAVRAFLDAAGERLAAPVFLDRDAAFSKRHSVTHLPGLLIFSDGARAYGGKLPTDPDALIREILEVTSAR